MVIPIVASDVTSLHKSCAEYPTEIQLSLHLDHPLKLQTGTSRFRERCDLCNYICRGLTFRCEVCNFKIDFTCARMLIDFRKNDYYYIKHYSHCHDLSINKKKMNDDACSYACNKHISVEGYSRSKCGFYLHKSRSLDLIEHYRDYKHIQNSFHNHPFEIVYHQDKSLWCCLLQCMR